MSNIIQEMTDEEFLDQFQEHLAQMGSEEFLKCLMDLPNKELPKRSSLDPLI